MTDTIKELAEQLKERLNRVRTPEEHARAKEQNEKLPKYPQGKSIVMYYRRRKP